MLKKVIPLPLDASDLVQILSTNLCVKSHPVPENLAGNLYCVDGISVCVDSILDLLERRIFNKEEQNGGQKDLSSMS